MEYYHTIELGGVVMLDIFRKTISAGIGAVSITKEKAEKFVDELVEKGQLKSEDAKKFVNELVERGDQDRNVISEMITKEVAKIKTDLGFVSKQEYDKLLKRIEELEAQQNK